LGTGTFGQIAPAVGAHGKGCGNRFSDIWAHGFTL
jgi:hypothetical protein